MSRLILIAKLSISVVKNSCSVLILNLITICFKLKKKKIIFFYHPKKTLTLMHKFYIEDLLEDISENYSVKANAEISLECNPDDLSKKKLQNGMINVIQKS